MLTQDLLNEIFKYDPDTGQLIRKVTFPRNPTKPDSDLTTYRSVRIGEKIHKVHRLIWLMVYGQITKGMVIDHINGDYSDNRLINLRLASSQENWRNQKLRVDSSSGFKGVSTHQKGFTASIHVSKTKVHIGCFNTAYEAALAYDAAAVQHFGEFARTNKMMGLLPNTSSNV